MYLADAFAKQKLVMINLNRHNPLLGGGRKQDVEDPSAWVKFPSLLPSLHFLRC